MIMETCPICSGILRGAKVAIEISGCDIGSFDGMRCEKCGEEFLSPESVNAAHAVALNKNLFGVLKKTETVSTALGFHESISYKIQTANTVTAPLASTSPLGLTTEVDISTTQKSSPSPSVYVCE